MEPEKKSNGAFVGLGIIVIILIIGGIYMWKVNQKAVEQKDQLPAITDQDSAELDALELDASSTDAMTGVDADAIN